MAAKGERVLDRAMKQDVAAEKQATATSEKAVEQALKEDTPEQETSNNRQLSFKIPQGVDTDLLEELKEKDEKELLKSVVPYLLMQSYHLPGYTYKQDLYQYLTNNHPLFGICLHHPLHPIKPWVRAVSLLGSLMMGLAITNIVYLVFVFSGQDYNKQYFVLPTDTTDDNVIISRAENYYPLSNGNLALWTVGAALNSLYDNIIWDVAAWNWNGSLKGRIASFESTAKYVIIVFCVVVAVALSTLAAAIRTALDRDGVDKSEIHSGGISDDNVHLYKVEDTYNFEFLMAFLIELAWSFLFYYFLIGFALFTGVFGYFGRIPVLGGRPYEVRKEKKALRKYKANEEGNDTENSGA